MELAHGRLIINSPSPSDPDEGRQHVCRMKPEASEQAGSENPSGKWRRLFPAADPQICQCQMSDRALTTSVGSNKNTPRWMAGSARPEIGNDGSKRTSKSGFNNHCHFQLILNSPSLINIPAAKTTSYLSFRPLDWSTQTATLKSF